ncbi:MAG: hypothetical protein PWP08_291 [Methanofollis sp.]|nr:hypothetical protein [Methanofollis sp.]
MRRYVIPFMIIIGMLFSPASASMVLFRPGSGGIAAADFSDCASDPEGEVFFATSDGLMVYNGSWTTYQAPPGDIPGILLSDTILSVEFGSDGKLWVGTSLGLQRFTDPGFETVGTQAELKNPSVIALQRWDDGMWVATPNSGVHRIEGDNWTWYRPFSQGGPGCRIINDMVLDPECSILYCISSRDGVWAIGPDRTAGFYPITDNGLPLKNYFEAETDPLGGIYLFNRDSLIHYRCSDGVEAVLSAGTLAPDVGWIYDVSAAPDGSLWIATDQGIFWWADGAVKEHLSRADGIWSNVIKSIYLDSTGRCWFSTPSVIGYYRPENRTVTRIPISIPAI